MLLRSVVLLISSVLFNSAVIASNEEEDKLSLALTRAIESRADSGAAANCEDSLSILLADDERAQIKEGVAFLVLDDYAGFLRGTDSVMGRILESPHRIGLPDEIGEALKQARERVSQNPLAFRVDLSAWLSSLAEFDVDELGSKPGLTEYLACSVVGILYGDEYLVSERAEIQEFYEGISSSSTVGYFDVELESCRVTNQLNTGNQFANPEVWEGSRFLVLDVTFKNKDKESRIPLPGSAFISVDGSIYEFDQPESIMARGYGVPLQGINPLVTYRTKLVYRVPDESFSDVFWQPGRNSEGKRLYCSL